ncbi:unnamed protein product [Rotaria magnacalcarata]|uniref:Uncharacterized protein n=5 Tax=Rotaria magnacalcarata TaxID=392030 RepID=A0A816SPC2_9BILA|nr:unnamed protein product [Rotaria magnacalcarata]
MLLLRISLVFISCISIHSDYSLFHTNIRQLSYLTFDCLYANLIDDGRETGGSYIRNYHLIPYCRRPDNDKELEQEFHLNNENIAQRISFDELRKRNITSEQLLAWFAPVDVAEKYEMNNDSSDIFYQCKSPWFGPLCQYKFGHDASMSFSDIVEATFNNYSEIIKNVTTGSCYRFLDNCNQELWPRCLDWREICDGKADCLHGEDERWCDQLDLTKCSDHEYRCHYGGQCIPAQFFKDSRISIDCLDGSDEQEEHFQFSLLVNPQCTKVQTFQCQERTTRYPFSFSCGDGQYLSSFDLPNLILSCSNYRDIEFSRAILTSLDHISDIDCRDAFLCAMYSNRTQNAGQPSPADIGPFESIIDHVWDEGCQPLSQHCMMEWIVIPENPTMFGFFQFVYLTNRSTSEFQASPAPDFICFDAQRCPVLLTTIASINIINDLTCCHISNLIEYAEYMDFYQLLSELLNFGRKCLKTSVEKSCINASYFHCNESLKCIPYHRVGDGVADCFYFEDEDFNACQLNDSNRFICTSDPNKCLSLVVAGNGMDDCPSGEDEVYTYTFDLVKLVPFPVICNGINDNKDYSLNVQETDEINCEWWPCNNAYTHCDGVLHCLNGVDELNCPNSRCSLNEVECKASSLEVSYCLPHAHLFDKYLDNCNAEATFREVVFYNGTKNISNDYLSWNNSKCLTSEQLCRSSTYSSILTVEPDMCLRECTKINWVCKFCVHFLENIEEPCDLDTRDETRLNIAVFLTSARFGCFPPIMNNRSIPIISKLNQETEIIPKINPTLVSYCHRGITVLHDVNETKVCLCPPNYFGARCQWQNQRISLTLQFIWRNLTSTHVIFQAIIMLIDEYGHVTPNYEQITYMHSRGCDTKFNIYLLYPNRPKNLTHKYSIRIDLFEKTTLNYWASWHFPIKFPFLPVNRIAAQLFIPDTQQKASCSLSCGEHGKCEQYIHQRHSVFFCRCNQGYSGANCEIFHECNCAKDSFCLAPFICVCPLYKFGSRCYLNHSICQLSHNPCQHNGICVPNDDRIDLKGFTCICSQDYSGSRCENINNRIEIYLRDTKIQESSLLFIHFITAFKNVEHQRITFLKKVPYNRHGLTLYVSQPFNILLLQIPNGSYYLGILRETFIPSEHIHTEIKSQQHCLPISKLLNNTIINSGYLNRTKYYPLLCRQNRTMMCFYDNDLICICDLDRFSNCFSFNHTMNYDCQGHNHCENGGQCFQNNETCPTKSTCVCQDCYYGTKCQFSTRGFLFALDPACVAIERMMSVIVGTRFNKQKSRKLAKSIISSVFIVTIITQIHDPIHRQLIDDIDDDERRIWCLTKYSSSARIYNSFINLFHFLVPFSINVITTLIMIKKIARRRLNIYPQQSYQNHFQRQVYRHQHLLYAPCMLILLSLPRFIISLSKRCMKSAHQPWIFLIGYFISFIPSMMTFVVFVLPSKNYKSELRSFYEQKFRRFRRNP